MLKRLIGVGAAALAAVVSGCGDGPATVAGWRSPAAWSSLVHATSKGPLLVEMHGTAFAMAAPDFRASVVEAMAGGVFGRPTAFTLDPQLAPEPRYRAVLAFNAPASTDPRDLCRGQVATAVETPERVTVHAAFCDGASLLASIRGWVAKVESSDDPRFRRLVNQLTRELFGTPQ